jgi:acetylornithine/succinyldiaminopimelate/putrescine aminotransferase
VPFGDIEALDRELKRGDVAAFVVEPIQGKGVYLASESYWRAVQAACRRQGTLLVIDEVQTGMGRTGRFFCHQHWGLEPDIITLSKALSGGYVPVGAVLTTSAVFDAVYSSMDRAVVHSSTFSKNQLAMVAGLATLQVIDDEDIVARAARNGARLMEALQPLVDRYELLHEVRGMGLMIGLVFGAPEARGSRARFKMMELARKGLFSQLIVVPLFHRHRILTQVAADNVNIIKLLPPLIIGDEEIGHFVAALDDVLGDAHRNSGLLVEVGATMARNSLRRGHRRPATHERGAVGS